MSKYTISKTNLKRYAILLVFLILFNYVLSQVGIIKYIVSLVIVVFVGLVSHKDINIKTNINYLMPNIVYIIIGTTLCVLNGTFSLSYVKMFCLLLVPFLIYVMLVEVLHYSIKELIYTQFIALLILYVGVERLADESQYAFAMGVFAIFFLYEKGKMALNNIISLFFIVVLTYSFMGKRLVSMLVILLIISSVLLRLLLKKDIVSKRVFRVFLFVLLVISFVYVYLCKMDLFSFLKTEYHILVSGRDYIYLLFDDYYTISPRFIGHGCGWAFNKISSYNLSGAGNLHNDLLMTYLDLGFIGFGVWIWSFISWCKGKKIHCAILFILGYTIANYMTDNIMIYVNYWLSTFLVMRYFDLSNSNDIDDNTIIAQENNK